MPNSTSIVGQIGAFGLLALVIVALGAIPATHELAIWLVGFLALAIILAYFAVKYPGNSGA